MNINELSPEDKKSLLAQLEAEQKAEKEKRSKEVKAYKEMVDGFVADRITILTRHQQTQTFICEKLVEDAQSLIAMKAELYDIKEEQDSHTFTARDGSGSFRIGYNVMIGFDGTEAAGVDKVKQYITTLAPNDKRRKVLTKIINTLLKEDKEGNLNPTRISELVTMKEDIGDTEFTEGVDIIVGAQYRKRSSAYVRGWALVKGESGIDRKLEFSFRV